MPKQLKYSAAIMIALSQIIYSCTTTRYTTNVSEVPDSRKLINSHFNCTVHELPSSENKGLTVSFEKINQYEFQEEEKEFKEMDNSGTRGGGLCTILFGSLLGGAVALGGTDEDGNQFEPNPDAGKGIFIGGLILGGILAITPDSKTQVSSVITSKKYEAYEPIQDQDSVYTIWSSIYPEKRVRRTLVNEEIELDVVTDLGLDYVENRDSIKVYFRSNLDETLIYTVDFRASDYLKQYLKVSGVSDSVSLYQAPTTNAPVIGHLTNSDDLTYVETKQDWYKVIWNNRMVYLRAQGIDYFFADH